MKPENREHSADWRRFSVTVKDGERGKTAPGDNGCNCVNGRDESLDPKLEKRRQGFSEFQSAASSQYFTKDDQKICGAMTGTIYGSL